MKKIILFISILLSGSSLYAQSTTTPSNISCTNPAVLGILKGNYNPADYAQNIPVTNKSTIVNGLLQNTSADTLAKYIVKLGSFSNRNTGSDTTSSQRGIGAARRWVLGKFNEYASASSGHLITSYLQFDQSICSVTKHKNIMAVMPGTDTTDKQIIIVEGHIDSRCEGLCDTTCLAEGIEDNATGTALVMELARTMSKYSYKRTIVFIVVIGEEQGLYGANAFAQYCNTNAVKIRAVLNNDVIGGVICGKTASPPTECVKEGDVDSTHMRIFSSGAATSIHKALARFIGVEYRDEVLPLNPKVPMNIMIMTPEDRTGRGGDHIPFRMLNYPAIRFTAAHEHGDASSNSPNYTDRQHSTRDTLGIDTDMDGIIDSFFVNFNYLKRNTEINGLSAAMAAIGPKNPSFTLTNNSVGLTINITNADTAIKQYKVSVRRRATDYNLDRLYAFEGTSFVIPETKKDTTYFVSVAATDNLGTESIFTTEQTAKAIVGINFKEIKDLAKLTIIPNPSQGETILKLVGNTQNGMAEIVINDALGKEINRLTVNLQGKEQTIKYQNFDIKSGVYFCNIIKDGTYIARETLVIEK